MSLLVTWHPAFAAFKAPREMGVFAVDVDRFARMIRGQLEPSPYVITEPTARDVRRLVKESEFIAVDIETRPESKEEPWTGKDPTRAKLKTIGLGNCEWGLSTVWVGGRLVEKAIVEVLENPRILKVLQNGPWFDLRILARYGIEVR